MELKQLKEHILQKSNIEFPLVFIYNKDTFLYKEYLKAIIDNANLDPKFISNLNQIGETEALFDEEKNNLYVLQVEELKENIRDLREKILVICKKDSCKDNSSFDVCFPDPLPWQIEDYVSTRLSGLNKAETNWLCEVCKYDIDRLDKECSKIEIFPKSSQEMLFDELNREGGYSDLSPFSIFNLSNALMQNNYEEITQILNEKDAIDIEATGLTTILLNQVKSIIDIQLNPRATAESLNMNPKRFQAIKYNCGRFSNSQLIKMFEFLTSIDYKLKSGLFVFQESANLDKQNSMFIDYIVTKFMELSVK